ncbi:MAG: C-terminal processing peptidase-2 [Candidatus Atelocyanobacterium thalassa isolate SIO64986]|uniref:C-terminal processing peptidase n=1 Tax=Candidatus Atelocyanobacterium thalassa isolate SIO64986 TaxID=1527444 RepID=A0A086CGC9_9CHRO|nr:MAG: C-terminal processing peptidase-2 [Candidatus Atelocyanobacterium thalassa isolate SIO64986]
MKGNFSKFIFFFVTLILYSYFILTADAYALTKNQKLLLESWDLLNTSYLDDTFNHQNWHLVRQDLLKYSLKTREDTYKAIDEMLITLDEPFTRLLRPEQYHNLQIETSGELLGVGLRIQVNSKTGDLEVVSSLKNSPAYFAGIRSHDLVLEIDGISTNSLTLDQAAEKMRGPIGTEITLTIFSSQDKKIYQNKIIRKHISLSPLIVNIEKTLPNLFIGYIRLDKFSANAAEEMKKAIEKLRKEGAKSYILDLRDNPGGLLQGGIDIARLWMNKGTIVYTINRQGIQDSFSSFGTPLTNAPLVLLVNKGTASSSEILAGALQDSKRAILLGERTFGKGLIQSLFELSDNSSLAITVARYETPNHRNIHKLGIQPDRFISEGPLTYDEIATVKDTQYQEAIKFLKEKNRLLEDG